MSAERSVDLPAFQKRPRMASSLLAALVLSAFALAVGSFQVSSAIAADEGTRTTEDGVEKQAPGKMPEELLGIEPGGDHHGAPDGNGKEAGNPAFHGALEDGFPDTPRKRRQVLSNLYAHLAAAPDAATANQVAQVIERIWVAPGSDTVAVLMERAAAALNERNTKLAIKFLDAVVELAPDYAEGWNRRALAYFMDADFTRSMGDLRRVLALEPNHFKALQGLAQILKDMGQDKGALKAYRQLLDVHPFVEGGEEALREVERKVEGQGI